MDNATGGALKGKVQVKVPATSGNLGPGFDCLGMAFELYDNVEVAVIDGPTTVEVTGEGAGDVPLNENHLVLRAFRRALDAAEVPQPTVALTCRNRIPQGRGLGSSAAAVVAGIMAARGLLAEPETLSKQRVLELATEFEGHPDNAAPAIYGGATASWMENGKPYAAKIPVAPEVLPILLVPDNRLATKAAREVLPAQLPFQDAVSSIGRVALLVLALGDINQDLFAATEDKVHQPYRAEVMPKSAALINVLRSNRLPAVISGAGPTVLLFGTTNDPAEVLTYPTESIQMLAKNAGVDLAGWRILPLKMDEKGAQAFLELR